MYSIKIFPEDVITNIDKQFENSVYYKFAFYLSLGFIILISLLFFIIWCISFFNNKFQLNKNIEHNEKFLTFRVVLLIYIISISVCFIIITATFTMFVYNTSIDTDIQKIYIIILVALIINIAIIAYIVYIYSLYNYSYVTNTSDRNSLIKNIKTKTLNLLNNLQFNIKSHKDITRNIIKGFNDKFSLAIDQEKNLLLQKKELIEFLEDNDNKKIIDKKITAFFYKSSEDFLPTIDESKLPPGFNLNNIYEYSTFAMEENNKYYNKKMSIKNGFTASSIFILNFVFFGSASFILLGYFLGSKNI
jgi:hypothetical protein